MQIEVESLSNIDFPAVTVCNHNGFPRTDMKDVPCGNPISQMAFSVMMLDDSLRHEAIVTDAWKQVLDGFLADLTDAPPENVTPTQFMAERLSVLSGHKVRDRLVDHCGDVPNSDRVTAFL